MRVATFNLLHGRSLAHGGVVEAELRAAAREIDADVVGMQEVDRRQPRSLGADQAAVVADSLGAPYWRFVPVLHGTPGATWTASDLDDGGADDGPAYGVALASRLPVRSWHVRRFGPAPVGMPLFIPSRGLVPVHDEPRVALAAVLDTASGPLTVVTAHLSFVPGWNVAQLRAVRQWVQALPAPRILLGDLNLPGPVARLATRWTSAARQATYPSWRPRVQFDHVLLDGLPVSAVRGARALRLPVSDHCGLVVDLSGHW